MSLFGEGAYTLASELDRVISYWLTPGMKLFAVLEWPQPEADSGAKYIVVFEAPDGAGPRLWVSDEGVVAFAYDPGKDVEAAATLPLAWSYLIPPP